MQINTSIYRIERFPSDNMSFTDIAPLAIRTGPATYSSDPATGAEMLNIPFSPEPATAEQERITIRVITADAEEEAAYVAALNARAGNQTYIDLASPTNAQVVAQVKALTRQNNAIILMLLRLMNK